MENQEKGPLRELGKRAGGWFLATDLASGVAVARLTREAKAALQRLPRSESKER